MDSLPEDILSEIFSRLDAKSVGKCRCLSNPWRSRLSTSHFINLHLSRQTREENLILLGSDYAVHIVAPPITDNVVLKKLHFQNANAFWTMLGSCNGLVLYETIEDEMFIVNPITQEQLFVPDSTITLEKHAGSKLYGYGFDGNNKGLRVHGFGYDSSTDDYKIVTLSYYVSDPNQIYALVDVYYLKLGVWKRIDTYRQNHDVPLLSYGVVLNGSIHWLSSSRESGYPSMIVAFDLIDEVFREIPAPANVYDGKFTDGNRLSVLGGCLSMVDSLNGSIDLWVMKEYGLVESWTKFTVETEGDHNVGVNDITIALCVIGDKEELVFLDYDELVVCNLQEKTTRYMVVDGVLSLTFPTFSAGTFIESLVSPSPNRSGKKRKRITVL